MSARERVVNGGGGGFSRERTWPFPLCSLGPKEEIGGVRERTRGRGCFPGVALASGQTSLELVGDSISLVPYVTGPILATICCTRVS